MAALDITSAVRSVFELPSDVPFNVTLKPCKNVTFLSILDLQFNSVRKQYVTVEANYSDKIQRFKDVKENSTLPQVFTFQRSDTEIYIAFQRSSTEPESLTSYLTDILKALAEYQSRNIFSEEILVDEKGSYKLRQLLSSSTYDFKDIKKDTLDKATQCLELDAGKVFKSGLLVNSLGFPISNREHVQLKSWNVDRIPPVFDALLYMFVLSSEKFRQKHFSELLETYFSQLEKSIEDNIPEYSSKLTNYYRETSVRVLLPVVKFEIINSNKAINSNAPEDLGLNISRFLKNPLINQEDIYGIITNKFHSTDFELVDYDMKQLNSNGGHLGQYFNLSITIKLNGETQTLQLFVKLIIPHNEFLRAIVENGPTEKEHFFYNTLLPLYKEHGLENLLDFAPQCFLTRENWMLVLEDLAKEGFRCLELNQNLDYSRLKAIVSLLAKYAASTLILEETLTRKNGEKVRMDKLFPGKFRETIYLDTTETPIGKFFNGNRVAIHYLLELSPEITEKTGLGHEEIIRRTDKLYESVFEKILSSDKFRNVITHGDMHLGNMMFCSDENDTVSKAVLVDFQVLRYVPPVFELLFFIYTCSSRDTRLKYIDQLVDDYYQDISKYLRDFQYDPEEVFSRDEFNESIKYIKSAVLSATCLLSHMAKMTTKSREEMLFDPEKFDYYVKDNRKAMIDFLWSDDYYKRCMKDLTRDIADYITNSC